MLSLNALTGTFCQNKLNRQWLEPASWFIRKPRCTRLAGMNGLVVRTMSFTGCAKLDSKDANNRSRSCGQGCELWPFPEGLRGARAHGSSGGNLAQFLKWLCAHCRGPLTVTLGLQEKRQSSPALCIQPNSRLCSHLLLPQIFPKRSGYSAGFSRPQPVT